MFIISDNIAETWFLLISGGHLVFSLMGEVKKWKQFLFAELGYIDLICYIPLAYTPGTVLKNGCTPIIYVSQLRNAFHNLKLVKCEHHTYITAICWMFIRQNTLPGPYLTEDESLLT